MADNSNASAAGGLTLRARREMSVSGVIELLGFDPAQIEVETADGLLIVRGSELTVGNLNAGTGELGITGSIDGMIYTERKTRGKQGILARMFK